MRKIFVSLTAFLVVIFLYACNRNAVTLDYTNAVDEVPQLGNLVFRFNKSVVSDSVVNNWDSTEYVTFEPEIPGRFRWEHPDELVFSPARPLPAATSFKATLNKSIVAKTEFGKIEKGDEIAFRTPDLTMEGLNMLWVLADEASKLAVPQVDISFNYPVDPNALKDKLQVMVDNKKADFSIQTLSASNKISLRLLNIQPEDKDYDAKITVAQGLIPVGGKNGIKETAEFKSIIPSPYVLTINEVSSEVEGGGEQQVSSSSDATVIQNGSSARIAVKTSQQIADPNPAAFVKLEPAVKFRTEITDEGFAIIVDNLDASRGYSLTINKGLRGKIGGVLKEAYEESLAFGELQPGIHFASNKAAYLSAQGARNIEVKLTNLPKVKLIISKIYESNLLTAQRNGYYPNEGGEERGYEENDQPTPGDIIYEKVIETASLPKYGSSRLLNFNFEDKIPDIKGIYHISIRSTEDYWISDSKFVSLSDIGLIAKEGREKMFVFANSIKSAKAVSGVNVLVYGYNNQLLGTGSTNNDGVAEVAYTRREFKGFKPALVIAKTAGDFNYLDFNSSRTETSRFDVGGKQSNATGMDAFIYAERDIYRPGETVHFSAILRNSKWESPGTIPVKMKFIMPTGKELTTFRKNLNDQGGAEGSVPISASAITGSYTLELYSANDVLLGNKSFKIEEFVPDRIKVTADLNKPSYLPGEAASLKVHAVNFFGPPASNRNYEAEIQVKQKMFSPKKYADYDFALANQTSFFDKVVREGKTDENGDASEIYQIPEAYKNIGLLQTTFYSTVFDETGRPVSRSAKADIYTQNVFLGVGNDGYGYYPLYQQVKFPVIALDKNEQPLSGAKAEVQMIKHEYRTVLTKQGSYFRYDSQKEDKLLSKGIIDVNANTVYSFVPKTPGDYELRISIPGAASYVSKTFYSYGSFGGDNSSFEVNTEGSIDISVDKEKYMAGEKAKVLFKTPFSGRMLVTMETDRVVSYQYINVDKRSSSLELPLNAELLPNAYITATLIKAHDVSEIPLTVAHGFQNITVEEKNRQISVAITAAKNIRSKTKQRITVKAASGSYVSLAAVDNGVLQVSGFETPDPYNYFYAKRALEVNGFDMYPLLFPELRTRLSSTGGDAALAMSKRTNPMPNKRIKIVSYWSGLTKVGGSGEASFDVEIPAFSGQVRLMAVAYKNNSFGSAEQAITVADPLVLSSTLPRFASPGDTLTMPVTISNTTTKSGSATATVTTSGPLAVVGGNSTIVSLTPNSETRVTFKVLAKPDVASGKIVVQVQGLGEKFTEETDLTVRPASTLQKNTGSGSVAGASSARLGAGMADLLPGSGSYQLVVSRSPALELGNQLNYLMRYPYGCTEQVISAAFPQLYAGELSSQFDKTNSNYNIQEAVKKIAMRQTYNGGIMLWDNESTQNWWLTAYAAQFLLEAKKAGYDVDKSLLETALGYINNRLKTKESITYYYNRTEQKKIAPKEVAYSLYVLATAGRPNVSVMNYYKSKPELLSLDSKYLLSAAYAVAGDKKGFRDILPASFSGEESVAQTGGSFYSDIRDEAISLNVLIDVDPANAQIPVMAKHVVDKLKMRSWYSTQESAFSFLALGKLAKAAASATVTGDVKVDGKVVGSASGAPFRYKAKTVGNVELVTKGQGRLYYWWETSGISLTGTYKEEDNYIKVRRRFFDRFGQPITGTTFAQNSLVVVQITVEKAFSGTLENVVVTDLLPAGFEIENPRTKELPGMEWIKDASTPTQLDVRDDRINLFVDMYSKRQVYYYAVRAVSPGVYRMGPVSADAMYNGEYHSYNGAMTVRVN